MTRVRLFPAWLTRHGYWLAPLLPLLMPLGWALRGAPGFDSLFAWFSLLVLYLLVPLLDFMIGRDRSNPDPGRDPRGIEIVVPLAAALSYATVLVWALFTFAANRDGFGTLATLGWTLSLANLGGVVAINVAHELIHRRDGRMRALGGALLSCVWYPCFKLEHPHWHHLHVATPADPSSAPLGSTIYQRAPRALVLNTVRGWRLGAEAAARKGRHWLRNEILFWYALSLGLTTGVGAWLGWQAMLVFLAHGLGAAVLLEVINYVEHYGLSRQERGAGRYERPRIAHSWESDFWLSNAFLLQLPRHPDHHVNPTRPFAGLQTDTGAPQLPLGYSALVMAAMVPPLWRALIHPRLPA